MKITDGIEYLIIRAIVFLLRILPRNISIKFGERLGKAINNIWVSRHNTVISNLTLAYGDKMSTAQKEEIAREVFGNLGKSIAENSRFPSITKEDILEIVTSEGTEYFQEAREYGKGTILVSSHFGNWELMAAYVIAIGYPLSFMIRSQHNELVDRYFTKMRRSIGGKVIYSDKSGGMKKIIRGLKDNEQVAIISDQHAGSQGIIIKFFGQPVSVPRGPAVLSIRTGAPIVVTHIFRNDDNRHHTVVDKPIYPNQQADQKEEIYRLTKLYSERMEEIIRSRPELWLWTHRRFKYKPPKGYVEGEYVN